MKKLYKIIVIVTVVLLLFGIGYIYSSIFGNPVVKLIAGHSFQKYVKLKYPDDYTTGKVSYNFKDQSYSTVLMDDNNEKYTYLGYYNNIISDNKEKEILSSKLNKQIHNLLEEINFKFDQLICSTYVCINTNQKFEAMENLDRYDIVYIKINDKDEISKEVFAEMVMNIIPEIKANMYYKEKSKIGITYQFDKEDKFHYIKFSVNEPDIKLTKDHIVENTAIETYR